MATATRPWTNHDKIHIHLSCHCHNFKQTVTLPTSVLPLKSSICHCGKCRHSTGHMFATFAVIPFAGTQTPSTTNLTAYASSSWLTRWFCGTCACDVWNDDRRNGEWEVGTGVISGVTYDDHGDRDDRLGPRSVGEGPGSPGGVAGGLCLIDGLLDRVQMWVGSTGDGGAAVWINAGTDRGMRRMDTDRESEGVGDEELKRVVEASRRVILERHRDRKGVRMGGVEDGGGDDRGGDAGRLILRCACGHLDMRVTRPTARTRFPAGIDACWTCRKTSGFEITSWTTVPADCFSWADGKPVTLEEEVFTRYCTTPGVMMRYHCSRCGVSLLCIKEGRDGWDAVMGSLEVEGGEETSGVRLEDWFVWTKYGDQWVAYAEDALDKGFVAALREGVRLDEGCRRT